MASSTEGGRGHLPRAEDIHLIWTADRSGQEFDLVRHTMSLVYLASLIFLAVTVYGRLPSSQKRGVDVSVKTTDALYTCLTAWWCGLHHVVLKETKPLVGAYRRTIVFPSMTTVILAFLVMSGVSDAQYITEAGIPHCETSTWQDGSSTE